MPFADCANKVEMAKKTSDDILAHQTSFGPVSRLHDKRLTAAHCRASREAEGANASWPDRVVVGLKNPAAEKPSSGRVRFSDGPDPPWYLMSHGI